MTTMDRNKIIGSVADGVGLFAAVVLVAAVGFAAFVLAVILGVV